MPRVKVNGWRFLYRQAGSGPDVVLLPGAANAPAGRLLFDVLAEQFRVTVYEPRGGRGADALNSADTADDLHGLQEKLGLERLHVMGNRAGALAALHAAVLYPEMVASLVLTEPCLPEARDGISRPARSGLTMRRILLIDQPVLALCGPRSPTLPLCRFLTENLRRCKAAAMSEDPSRLAARIQDYLSGMADVAADKDMSLSARPPKPGPRGPWSRLWPETADGHAIARWMSRLSAWGL